jgi:hypothetical protein|eukprot:COSAG02_NODE_4053_length_5848_cov_1.510002_2_plen_60_part_00
MDQVGWPCADLSVGDELVVNSEACEAAWAKLQRSGDTSAPSDGVSCQALGFNRVADAYL